jgi:TrmH family RNA methyltransferase
VFSLPVVEATSTDAMAWLRAHGVRTLAASPHTKTRYTDVAMTGGTAIVVGTEQYGLSDPWMHRADMLVRIPMLGQGDSLNVACAATLLLYEAVRQRAAVRGADRDAGPPSA